MITRPDDTTEPRYEQGEDKLMTVEIGLTKRELFAAIALQGFLANPSRLYFSPDAYTIQAVALANSLIEQLNQPSS